ncbi:hypothetical protein [Planktothricoides raciborskii]|nr:hypothetical protein [Planktothricoides raciborskii]
MGIIPYCLFVGAKHIAYGMAKAYRSNNFLVFPGDRSANASPRTV